ncbi:MAG: DUF5615 family PIN-like protein [Acidobacteriia bacterium]|nr:DUF5615 family PIN-like protein [Terriglobia bacterium]
MRLLFDQNLSYRLPAELQDFYPDPTHVRECGLIKASDEDVWNYATTHRYAIASKDGDFHQRSFLRGFVNLLRTRVVIVAEFLADLEQSFLALSR